jgi:chromosome segregation ATPase
MAYTARVTPSPSPAATSSLSTSLSRVAPYVDPAALEGGGKRLSELELENSRLNGKLAIVEREVHQKDQEIRRLVLEHRTSKNSLEKVIKDLVDKQKQMESDFQRKQRHQDEALQKLSSEHLSRAHAVSDVKQTMREFEQKMHEKDREIERWRAAHGELEREEHHLQEQFDALHQQAQRLEGDLAHSRQQEEEAHEDLEVAMLKLQKADEHIHKLSAEAEHNTIELVRLRHLCEASEVDAQASREEQTEITERLAHLARSAAGEMDRLTLECDELLEYVKSSALARSRGTSTSSSGLTDSNRAQRLFLLSPEKASTPVTDTDGVSSPRGAIKKVASTSPQNTVTLMRRLVEALSLVREDLTVTHRAAVEFMRNAKDMERKVEILTEALQHERTTAIEAADRADAIEQTLKADQEKIAVLESNLAQSARWMEEAATLGEESSSRTEKLIREQREYQAQVEQARDELLRTEHSLRKKEDELRSSQHVASLLEQQLSECKERLRLTEKRQNVGSRETEDLQQKLKDKENLSHQLESVISKLDGEKTFLARQLSDAEDRTRSQVKHVESVEASNSDLRNKLFDTQKRLDNVLRQVSVTSTTSSTPLRQRSVTSGTSPHQRRPSPSTSGSRYVLDEHQDTQLPPTGKRSFTPSKKDVDVDGAFGLKGAATAAASGNDKVKSWEDRLNSLLNSRSRV